MTSFLNKNFTYKVDRRSFFLILLLVSLFGALTGRSILTGFLLIGAFSLFIVGSIKAEVITYLFLFSSIFFKYRIDIGIVSFNLYRILFLFCLATIPFLRIRQRHILSRQVLQTAIIVFLLLILFILGWYRSPNDFRSAATSNTFLLVSWLAFLLYLTLFVDRRRRLQNIIKVYLFTSTTLAIYGIYEAFIWIVQGRLPQLPFAQYAIESNAPFVWLGTLSLPRIESFFHDANLLAIYLVIATLLLLSYLMYGDVRTTQKLMFGVVLFIHCLAIVLTVSRSGILLLIFSILLLLVRRANFKMMVNFGLLISVGGVVILLLAFLSSGSLLALDDYSQAFVNRLNLDDDAIRLQYAQAGFDLFVSSPIVGVGMGNSDLRNISKRGIEDTTHSFYLTILAHYGIVGFIIILLLLLPLIRESVKVLLQHRASPIDMSLAAAVWVIFLFQFVYDNLLGELMLFPFALLYIWALNRRRFRRSQSVN